MRQLPAMMTKSVSALALGLLGLLASSAVAEQCGDAIYDPAIYVCHDGQFLCPVINGEPLSYCSGACYSRQMYRCASSVLSLLPELPSGTAFGLTASNPALPAVNGLTVSACGRRLWIGGPTCSYCPVVPVGDACPQPGNVTALVYSGGMHTMVPGGQQYYIDPSGEIGYTQAHSAYVPPGAVRGGIAAYADGGFVNLNPGARGWVACPPAPGGEETRWRLVAKSEGNAGGLGGCTGVNLLVRPVSGLWSVWQYT